MKDKYQTGENTWNIGNKICWRYIKRYKALWKRQSNGTIDKDYEQKIRKGQLHQIQNSLRMDQRPKVKN